MNWKIPSVAVMVILGLAAIANAVEFKIESVGREKKYVFVDNAWIPGSDCVELKVSVSEKQTANQVIYRAYFFDKDNKPVFNYKQPSQIHDPVGEGKSFPDVLEKSKPYSVFFAIPKELTSGEKKWKRVVVVFGSKARTVAEVFPKDDIKLFEFPEKAKQD